MFGLGIPELCIILVIMLMIFGVGKLPELGKALGMGIKNFKRAFEEKGEIEINPKQEGEIKKSADIPEKKLKQSKSRSTEITGSRKRNGVPARSQFVVKEKTSPE